MLTPVGSWDVRGGPDRASWFYRCDVFGPSGNLTHFVPHDAVIHAQYAVDPARPWHGISPLQWARSTGTLAANLEQRLGEEAGGSVGHFLPLPLDGGDDDADENADPMRSFKADIRAGKGRTLLVESVTGGWGDGPSGAPLLDYQTHRFGADPPAALGALRNDASMAILNACGVPPDLVTSGDSQGQREAVETVRHGFRRAAAERPCPAGARRQVGPARPVFRSDTAMGARRRRPFGDVQEPGSRWARYRRGVAEKWFAGGGVIHATIA